MLYVESSALVKKYYWESGTEAVSELLGSDQKVGSSLLTLVEVETVLGRRFREGILRPHDLHRIRQELLRDWHNVEVVPLAENVISEVRRLALTLPLTAGDAIHLASALLLAARIEGLVFCSADASLLRSAAAEGLPTWSPLAS